MKKVLLALILVLSALTFIGFKVNAAGTGNLVVHFQSWDGNYDTLGSWAWGGPAAGKLKDGVDDFGAYWNYNDIPLGTSVGFIAVEWPDGNGPDWNQKLTGDINISADAIIEDTTVHVYVFEGAATSSENPGYFMADPTVHNVMVIYYDPAGAYEENLGMHAWGWKNGVDSAAWNEPSKVFTDAGKAPSGFPVKGVLLSAQESWAGFLIYYGDGDGSKKTGDLKPDTGWFTEHGVGTIEFVYVVSAGDGNTSNENVYTDVESFVDDAFTFKLLPFAPGDMSGTYAVDPQTIIVKTSATVTNPYPDALDKEAATATIESWFAVREIIEEGVYGDPLMIERVDFAKNNATLNAFVLNLSDELDNTKEYEVFFSTTPALAVAKDVEVTINLTVPANTPDEAVLSLAGSVQGWNPGDVNFTAVQVGDTLEYTLVFTVSVTDYNTVYEYKWTRGAWGTEEHIADNRKMIIPNTVDAIEFDDVILSWTDIEAPVDKYAAPDRGEVMIGVEASLVLAMDTEAPVISFIAPQNIVGVPAAERVINVTWGQPFTMTLFPRFRANDDRDGEITAFVYVPKGENSVLDTRVEGDYTIMLRVLDNWGNVAEETFIFRVSKTA